MSEKEKLLAWAQSWHWPRLVLSEHGHLAIPAGEQAWRSWLANTNSTGIQLAQQRIERWQQIVEQKAS